MLLTEEIQIIVPILRQIIVRTGMINRQWIVSAVFAQEFPTMLAASAALTASPDEVANAVIQLCLSRGWADFPSTRTWLERLLSAIDGEQGQGGVDALPQLGGIVARLKNGDDIQDTVWKDMWLRFDEPMVDRRGLRNALQQFVRFGTSGRPILRIEGEGKVGKSHSHELMEHASGRYGTAFRIARIEMKEEQKTFYTSVRLAQGIVAEFNPRPPSPLLFAVDANVPEKAHLPGLCTWVTANAELFPHKWWLVLDGFSRATPQSLTLDFIELLAERVAKTSASRFLRLVLIDYGRPLAQVNENNLVAFDRPSVSEINPTTIKDCLAAYLTRAGKVFDDDELQARSQAIFDALPAGPDRLLELNRMLLPAAQSLVTP
jgi:hypothetical protein